MFRKLTVLLLALLLPASALAEVYEGTTAALSAVTVAAERAGVVGAAVEAGSRVEAGDALAELKPERAFASQDGKVSLVYAGEGDAVDGTVLELAPLERYAIHCTVEKAYQSAEATLVHGGEAVYVRCTADGSHRAVGVVTQVDGAEYRVLTTGGELYVGETVYLYRDGDFTAESRVGIGTVVGSDVEAYGATGTLTALKVSEGDPVERGQLLYEINGGSVAAPASGIIASVEVAPGDTVREGDALAQLVPDGQVCVEIRLSEVDAAQVSPGQRAELTPAGTEEAIPGTVLDVAWVAGDGAYVARILPEEGSALPLGLGVTVRLP